MSSSLELLPIKVGESVEAILESMDQTFMRENLIGKGAFGYVYETKNKITKVPGACKIIVLPEDNSSSERSMLLKTIETEV